MPYVDREFIEQYPEPFNWREGFIQAAVAFAAGVLAGLGQAPFSLIFLSLPGFAAMFWFVRRAATPRGSMVLGYIAGCGYFAVTLFWIVEPFFVYPTRHGWMAPFALIFLAGGLALFWGVAVRLAHWLAGRDPGALEIGTAWVVAMSLAELARAYLFTGFPWAMPGYIWSDTGFAQLGAVIGPHGLNFVTFAFAAALTGFAFPGAAAKIAGVIGAIVPTSLALTIHALMPAPQVSDGPMLRIVQPNAPQDQKWDPRLMPIFYERSLSLTGALSDTPPDIVIWPETSTPRLLHDPQNMFAEIAEAAGGAEVIAGGIRRTEAGPLNELFILGGDGVIADSYHKHRLVPFGEYTPFLSGIAALGWEDFADGLGSGFVAGEGAKTIASRGGAFQPLICYEAIFPHFIGATPARPNWLLQITNDAWFGKIAGPQQHLAQARMRAIEQGLPMVRAANTGISAVIDARGRVLGSLAIGTSGALDLRLPKPLPATPYALFGDWPILGLLILCALVTVFQRWRNMD